MVPGLSSSMVTWACVRMPVSSKKINVMTRKTLIAGNRSVITKIFGIHQNSSGKLINNMAALAFNFIK